MRRALERACALVQLASGGTFAEVWNVDEEARRLSHCADLMTFLDSLPRLFADEECRDFNLAVVVVARDSSITIGRVCIIIQTYNRRQRGTTAPSIVLHD